MFLTIATKHAANAAKAAAEHIPKVERGYIVGGGPRDLDGQGNVYVSIGNYGKTAAILTKVEWGYCVEEDFPVDAPVSELLKSGRLKAEHCQTLEDVLPGGSGPNRLNTTKISSF